MSHNPTAEQTEILSTFAGPRHPAMVVQAGAGTGKTSTMRMVAEANPDTRFKLVAFNRSIVAEAAASFPENCEVRTMHSHAYRAVVKNPRSDFGRRLNAPRMKGDQVARELGIRQFNITFGTQTKVLQPGYLAGAVMRAVGRFCDSADRHPHQGHVEYIDGIDAPDGGKRTYDNNDRVREYLEPFLATVWRDLTSTTGRLRFDHGHYLKMWELSAPRMDCDALMVDEAQDLNPVMLSICEQQTDHLQLVAVGDSQQSIYGWRGAVDALDRFDVDATLYLTQSFRFGPAIAAVANAILTKLDAELRLTGLPTIASDVAHLTEPACYLMRTNALAVQQLITEQVTGRSAYLIGGGKDVLNFVRACAELQTKGYTSHPELSCFTSWNEVQAYVAEDPSGSDLGLMVRLVEDHGAEKIQTALERMPARERDAEVVISTAHKAKGREWRSVKLGGDFRDPKDGGELVAEEWRLLYVAATRAQGTLDPHAAAPLARLLGLTPDEDPSSPGARIATPAVPAAVPPIALGSGGSPTAPSSAAPRGGVPLVPAPALMEGIGCSGIGSSGADGSVGHGTPKAPVPALPPNPVMQSTPRPTAQPIWLIGKCSTPGCRFGIKLRGNLVIEDHKFRGVTDPDGKAIAVPKCPTHHLRPWLKVLHVLPPDGSRCNSSCQHAFKPECACACAGANHGKAHLVDVSALESEEVTS